MARDRASLCDRPVLHAQDLELADGLDFRVEHICLEGEEPAAAPRTQAVHGGPSFRFTSRMRGCETQFSFTAQGRLTVRTRLRGAPAQRYAVDLRFVDTGGEVAHRIAWRWWAASVALILLCVFEQRLASQGLAVRWQALGLQGFVLTATAASCCVLLAAYRTHARLVLRSLHGGARLAEVIGGLGSTREMRQFVLELSQRASEARRRATQPMQHFLRDEMREHHRLWNEGVLSVAAYEACKRRILAAHGDGTGSVIRPAGRSGTSTSRVR
jgi:hypothetical protein